MTPPKLFDSFDMMCQSKNVLVMRSVNGKASKLKFLTCGQKMEKRGPTLNACHSKANDILYHHTIYFDGT